MWIEACSNHWTKGLIERYRSPTSRNLHLYHVMSVERHVVWGMGWGSNPFVHLDFHWNLLCLQVLPSQWPDHKKSLAAFALPNERSWRLDLPVCLWRTDLYHLSLRRYLFDRVWRLTQMGCQHSSHVHSFSAAGVSHSFCLKFVHVWRTLPSSKRRIIPLACQWGVPSPKTNIA